LRRVQAPASFLSRVGLVLALTALACSAPRAPRPTLLDLPPPVPPPGTDEARLMPVELTPDASEPLETVPAPSIHAMARRALDDAQGSIVACYEAVLVAHPGAAGRVEVQLDLAASGAVTRAHVDHRGDEGFEAAVPCVEAIFRGLRVRDVPPGGQYVSRVYTFANPTLDRVVAAPVVVRAPPPRARGRRGARATDPPPPAPPSPTPVPGPGSLRADELALPIANATALPACAALALRRARRPAPPLTLRLAVGGDGRVSGATVDATVPPTTAAVMPCVTAAVAGVRYRASGIAVRAVLTLAFRR
jgi:hypothetical protein